MKKSTSEKNSFAKDCYELLRRVPQGYVTTYKDLALALNSKAFRAVGQIMKKNPYAPEVPCHRVVCSNGNLGDFVHGKEAKKKLLEKEGLSFQKEKILNFDKHKFLFPIQKKN